MTVRETERDAPGVAAVATPLLTIAACAAGVALLYAAFVQVEWSFRQAMLVLVQDDAGPSEQRTAPGKTNRLPRKSAIQ